MWNVRRFYPGIVTHDAPSAVYEHRYAAVRDQLMRLAAHQHGFDTAPSMRTHDDEIAFPRRRHLDDFLERIVAGRAHDVAVDARRLGGTADVCKERLRSHLGIFEIVAGRSLEPVHHRSEGSDLGFHVKRG